MRRFFHSLSLGLLLFAFPYRAASTEITVTLPPLAGLVAMLDKEAEVACLLQAGTDPHHFQLQPRSIESLRRSRLLIRAERDDRSWPLPPRHANSLNLWPETDHGWLSPAAVRGALPKIADALVKLHPDRAAAIHTALQQALAEIDAVDAAWHKALSPVRTSGVIMHHPAWQRLMREMEIPVLSVLESGQHGHEHGPRHLDEALTALKQHPGAWLISSEGHSSQALQWLASHAEPAPRLITLDPLGHCGATWPEFMHTNLRRVKP